jgi:hypothetical protein
MRHAFRSCRLPLIAALAAALLPLAALAQEADETAPPDTTFLTFVTDAAWMKHSTQLDEDTLDLQRGRATGMLMVAAAPQLLVTSGSGGSGGNGGNGVTLWDEIAPPTPLPIPVDAQRAMQSNNASYTRK